MTRRVLLVTRLKQTLRPCRTSTTDSTDTVWVFLGSVSAHAGIGMYDVGTSEIRPCVYG